ncbi:hypothetical protein [Nocardia crassostreae]|uniref:hypothetical protein n=1 Tax=Nocardia crassostreae TaxID=53428 RepID=UPI000AB39F68|nr:hypothetical protein [Nocardia crassostreae]
MDPPADSLRARVGPWSLQGIITLASVTGGVLGVLYSNLHSSPLFDAWIPHDEQPRLQTISGLFGWFTTMLVLIVTNFMCRKAFLVWRGLQRGERYDPAELAAARRDTLVYGDRVAWVAFAGWLQHAVLTPFILLHYTDLSVPQALHFAATLLVAGTVAVAYPFFLITFFIVRCIYPALLIHGETTSDDRDLRALSRRCTRYLAVAASIPLIAVVTGFMALKPDEVSLVIEPMKWLCLAGVLGFLGDYWLFRQLEADLRAFERTVAERPELG